MTLPTRWTRVIAGFPESRTETAILETENEVRPGRYEIPEDVLVSLLVGAGYTPERKPVDAPSTEK